MWDTRETSVSQPPGLLPRIRFPALFGSSGPILWAFEVSGAELLLPSGGSSRDLLSYAGNGHGVDEESKALIDTHSH